MKYTLSILGLAIVVIAATIFLGVHNADKISSYAGSSDSVPSDSDANTDATEGTELSGQTTDTQTDQTQAESTSGILQTELSTHDNLNDCWISYDGKVYDITTFLPNHPGSAGAILPYCGTAEGFEEAFTRQHGTSKVSYLMKVGTYMGDFTVVGALP